MTLKIRYVQSGGLAGLVRECVIDAAALAPAAAATVRRLVKAAPLAKLQTKKTGGAADLLLHDFSIETDAGAFHLSFDDLSLPAVLKPLVTFLARRSKPIPPRAS
jgi:hypothetical protein